MRPTARNPCSTPPGLQSHTPAANAHSLASLLLAAGGPLIARTQDGKAVVVGVTSHGPDCQSQPNNPNYAYGFYTGVLA